mmetsp:Transcript_78042/g.215810  ORF Transcript_78042/g.215810 Transcript_78042/m.215810 type:complete len:209 (-) Transcript_78042:543-1169(-)
MPLSFVRPPINSSGETVPLLSASMRSKICSASCTSMLRSRSFSTIFSEWSSSTNSSRANSPFPSRSAIWNSSPMDFMMSNSVASRTLLLTFEVSSIMVCKCSTITATMMFVMPKVQTVIAMIRKSTATGLTSKRGRATSTAQRSSVMTWITVHMDLHGVPKYCSRWSQYSSAIGLSMVSVVMITAMQYVTRRNKTPTQVTVKSESNSP